jgi:uncharacterized membrane protein
MLLLVIGFYAPLTNMIKDMMTSLGNGTLFSNWTPLLVLGLFVIGLLVGFVLISLLMKFLLEKHKLTTYFGIIGFIIGSVLALYFNYEVVWMYSSLPWWHIPVATIQIWRKTHTKGDLINGLGIRCPLLDPSALARIGFY